MTTTLDRITTAVEGTYTEFSSDEVARAIWTITAEPGTCELSDHAVPAKRTAAASLASATCARSRMVSTPEVSADIRNWAAVIRCTRNWMSIRSSNGPEIRLR